MALEGPLEAGTWQCKKCGRDVAKRLEKCPRCGPRLAPEERQARDLAASSARRVRQLATGNHGPRSNRERTYRMIDFLAGISGKYRRVMSGQDMALISIIGTEDWEDYANLSFTAMQAEGHR